MRDTSQDAGKTTAKPAADKCDTSPRLVWGIFIVLLILWAAHVYAAYVPSGRLWGLLHGFALPPLWRWVVWLAGLILIFPPLAGVVARKFGKFSFQLPKTWVGVPSTRQIIILVWLFVPLFVFRSRAFIFGDGYRMLDRLAEAGPSVLFSADILKETLDFAWHWLNHRFWAEPLGLSPEFTYGFLNSIAGALLFLGLARLIRELAKPREHRLLLWSAILSSGTLLLGFGYVESYTWAFTGVVWAVVYAVRSIDKPALWRVAFVVWIIAVGFHLLALIFAPAILGALGIKRNNRQIKFRWAFVSLGALMVGGALVASQLFDISLFVFPPPGQSSPYLLWSPAHLSDMLNILLLVAPATLPLCIVLFGEKQTKPNRAWSIVLITAISAWWAALLIDPSLGAARDWDLISYFGPFLALSSAGLFLIRRPNFPKKAISVIAVQLLGLAVFHAVPWVAAHQDAGDAVELMDVMLVDDPHLSIEYAEAARAVDFGQFLISDKLQRYDLGTKYFKRRVSAVPDDPDALWSLGTMYWYRGLADSCYDAYHRSLTADSTNTGYWHNFGLLHLGQNQTAEAKYCFGKVLKLEPRNWRVAWALGEVYHRERLYDSAAALFQSVARINPDYWEAFYAAGMEFMHGENYQAALNEFDQAIRINPTEPIIYRRILEIHLLQKKFAALWDVLRNWKRAVTPQTINEVQQWETLAGLLPSSPPNDPATAAFFARIAEWYVIRNLEHVAYDFYRRAVQLDSTEVTYRTRAEEIRTTAKSRSADLLP